MLLNVRMIRNMRTGYVKMKITLTLKRTAYIYSCIPLSFVVLVIQSLVTPWELYISYELSSACNSVPYYTECT